MYVQETTWLTYTLATFDRGMNSKTLQLTISFHITIHDHK